MEYVFLISVVIIINFTMSALCFFEYLDRGKSSFGWLYNLIVTMACFMSGLLLTVTRTIAI